MNQWGLPDLNKDGARAGMSSRRWEGSKDAVNEGNNWHDDGAHEAGHDYSESEEDGTEYRYGVGDTVDGDLFVATVTGDSAALGVAIEGGANNCGMRNSAEHDFLIPLRLHGSGSFLASPSALVGRRPSGASRLKQ